MMVLVVMKFSMFFDSKFKIILFIPCFRFCQVLIQEMGFVLDIEFLLELASLVEPLNTKPTDVGFVTNKLLMYHIF